MSQDNSIQVVTDGLTSVLNEVVKEGGMKGILKNIGGIAGSLAGEYAGKKLDELGKDNVTPKGNGGTFHHEAGFTCGVCCGWSGWCVNKLHIK